jgi:glycerol-3-phosphate dehydrogenase
VAAAGTHISMPSELTKSGFGLILATDDDRILFLLPWLGKTVAGTTDEVRDHIEQHTLSTQSEVEFIISNISQSMKLDKFSTEELVSSKWCGLRPLVLGDEAMKDGSCHNAVGELKPGIDTRFLTRTHEIEISESGLLSIMGGKWTTFRKMGEEAVDAALKIMLERDLISTEQQRRQAPHKSHMIRFIGDYRSKTSVPNTSGITYTHDEYKAFLCEALKKHFVYDDKFILYVANVYGDRAFDLLRYIKNNPRHQQKIHSNLATLRYLFLRLKN